MTSGQVLRQVEVPNGLPLIMSGLRSAVLQVVATATVAAFIGLGGLGRYLIDGIALGDYPETAGGAILVAVLAVVLDGSLRPRAARRRLTGPLRSLEPPRQARCRWSGEGFAQRRG